MNIVITNTAALNTGDAAILIATVDILRKSVDSQPEIVIHDQQPAEARNYYPDFEFHPLLFDLLGADGGKWGRRGAILGVVLAAMLWHTPFQGLCRRSMSARIAASLDRLASADLIVSAGGTYLVPHYRIFPKLLELLVAAALRRPYVLFTQSLGPFHAQRRSWLVRSVLGRARAVLVRDRRSYHHLIELGVPADRVAACADAAFALAPEAPLSTAEMSSAQGMRRVAISVRDWPHFPTGGKEGMAVYHAALAALVQHIVTRYRAEVTFLSTCQGVEEYWTDDSDVAETVVSHLPDDIRRHVQVDHAFHDPRALLAGYAEFDLVVATRMHAAILALCAGVPVLPVAYEFKTAELFSGLGLGEYVQRIETITGERLCRTFDRFVEEQSTIRRRLGDRIAEARRSAMSAGRYVTGTLTEETV